ncbi:hypothetical protein ABGB18_47335 [Nonomuraea sp. B12E4]|uniref:hypothetical protein n=1 Tax=Nonomuraea sp. B12E4 TaxID=3153564 RepID=UPI00325EB64D
MTHSDSDRDEALSGQSAERRAAGMRWGWFGAGVVIAGVAVAGWGHALRWSLVEEPSNGLNVMLLLTAGLLLAPMFAVIRLVRMAAPPDGNPRPIPDAVHGVHARVVLAVLVVCPFALYGLVRLQRGFMGGLPEPGDVLFGLGMTFAAAGLVVLGKGAAGLTTRSLTSLCAGLLTVVAVAQTGLLAAETLPIEATTAVATDPSWTGPGPAPENSAPASVSKVAWQWRPPDGGTVLQSVAAGGHVVVRVFDGVVALDSVTGRERWHYRRPGAAALQLLAAPDGDMVAVEFGRESENQKVRDRTVLLDAHTGGVLSEQARGLYPDAAMTSYGFVTADADDETVVGWDLRDIGEAAWSYRLPRECDAGSSTSFRPGPWHVNLRNVIALPVFCHQSVAVIALNPRSGDEVWRYEWPWPHDRPDIVSERAQDGSALWLRFRDGSKASKEVVLAQEHGEELGSTDWSVNAPAAFSTDGYLTRSFVSDWERYRWTPYSGGESKLAEPALGSMAESALEIFEALRLEDGLLMARAAFKTVKADTVTIEISMVGWGATRPTNISFDLGYHRTGSHWRDLQLLPVSGAVVVAFRGGTTVVGLT